MNEKCGVPPQEGTAKLSPPTTSTPTASTSPNPASQPCSTSDSSQVYIDALEVSLATFEQTHATGLANLKKQLANLKSSSQSQTQTDDSDTIAQLKTQIEELLQLVKEWKDRTGDAERGLEQQEKRRRALETRHNEKAQAQRKLLENITTKIEALETELEHLKTTLSEQKTRISKLENGSVFLKQEARNAKLQSNNEISLRRIAELESLLFDKEKAYKKAKQDAEEWENLVKKLRQEPKAPKLTPKAREQQKKIDELANEVSHYCDLKQASESRVEELEDLLAGKRASLETMLAGNFTIARQHETQPNCSVLVIPLCLPVLTKDVDGLLADVSWKDTQRMYEDQLGDWYYERTGEYIEREEETTLHSGYASDENKDVKGSEEEDEPAGGLPEQSSAGTRRAVRSQASYTQATRPLTGVESDNWRSKKGAEKFCRRVRNGYNSRR
jgi:hypothetical protein